MFFLKKKQQKEDLNFGDYSEQLFAMERQLNQLIAYQQICIERGQVQQLVKLDREISLLSEEYQLLKELNDKLTPSYRIY